MNTATATKKAATNSTAIFSIRPRSASWQDRREFVGVEAAVEAIVEIKLTGEAVELMERTSEEHYSYRNARIRKIEREAAHRLAARDAGTPAETGYTAETGRVAVRGVVVGYVYGTQHARKATEYTFVTADGTEIEIGAVEVKLGQSWADALGEAAIAVAEEHAAPDEAKAAEEPVAVLADAASAPATAEDEERTRVIDQLQAERAAHDAALMAEREAREAKPRTRRADILPRTIYAEDAVALVRFPLGNGASVTEVFAWDADRQALGARLGPVTLRGGTPADLTYALNDQGFTLAETRDHLGYSTTIWTRA